MNILNSCIKKATGLTVFPCLFSLLFTAEHFIFTISKPSYFSDAGPVFILKNILECFTLLTAGISILYVVMNCLAGLGTAITKRTSLTALTTNILNTMMLSFFAFIIIEKLLYRWLSIGVLGSSGGYRAFFTALLVYLPILFRKSACRLTASECLPFIRRISVSLVLFSFLYVGSSLTGSGPSAVARHKLPNIILVGADGLAAADLSLYGNPAGTTPFLDSIRDELMIAESAFTNNAYTPGSVVSLLNGIHPIRSHVFDMGHNLPHSMAYKNLPGLLKKLGYRTLMMNTKVDSYLPWVDPFRRNMLGAFDHRYTFGLHDNPFIPVFKYPMITDLLISVSGKVQHALWIKNCSNPYTTVTGASLFESDDTLQSDLMQVLSDSDKPLFAHIHFMGSHGPFYGTGSRRFSENIIQKLPYQKQHLYDAVLDFDNRIRNIYSTLKSNAKLDSTILIIYSDHGPGSSIADPVPLIIRFPESEHAGTVTMPAQLIDVAPTMLDFLNIDIPSWMDGNPLTDMPDENRLIVSVRSLRGTGGSLKFSLLRSQFGRRSIVVNFDKSEFIYNTEMSSGDTLNEHAVSVEFITEMTAEFLNQNHFIKEAAALKKIISRTGMNDTTAASRL